MKRFIQFSPLLILLFIASCRDSNDLLSRIFSRAFKSKVPMVTQTDNLWQPLIGYYVLENERVVHIFKKDAKTYQVDFLQASVSGSGMTNTATTCMAGNTRFFNLLSYQNNFLFFKVKSVNDSTYSLDFVSRSVDGIIGDTAQGPDFKKWWVKNENKLAEHDALFDSYKLEKYTDKDALAYHRKQLRGTVSSMENFEKYKEIYPNDIDLETFRISVLSKQLNNCNSIYCVKKLIGDYPEITSDGMIRAKTLCTTTYDCVQFVQEFPTDTAVNRLTTKAFALAKTADDMEKLVTTFPNDKRSDNLRLSLVRTQAEECLSDEDYAKLTEKYKLDQKSLKIINTIKVFNQITPSGTPFNTGSHVLTSDGKRALDKIADFVTLANQEQIVLSDLYFAVSSADRTDSLPEEISFVLSMNRCASIKKYLSDKKLPNVSLHFVPVGNGVKPVSQMNPQISLGSFEGKMKIYKDVYQQWCFSSGQTLVVPDGKYEYPANNWMNEQMYIDYIKQKTLAYFNTYKKGSTVNAIVPVHLWNEEAATDKTAVAKFKEELKPLAKKAGISKKAFPQLGYAQL